MLCAIQGLFCTFVQKAEQETRKITKDDMLLLLPFVSPKLFLTFSSIHSLNYLI
jgi:hypothetical protein